jgi:hypothetical protein
MGGCVTLLLLREVRLVRLFEANRTLSHGLRERPSLSRAECIALANAMKRIRDSHP